MFSRNAGTPRKLSESGDLQTLVAQDLIVRTHGGAVLSPRASELSLLARNLCEYRDLTILAHSSVVAQVVLEVLNATVVMTSGIVRRDTVS